MPETEIVQLIVTGDVEFLALAASLQPVFPSLVFRQPIRIHEITTNCLVPYAPGASIPSTMQTLAGKLVQLAMKDDAAHALAVADLELANAHQPHIVREWIRAAVVGEIDATRPGSNAANERLRERVRERCSVHFLKPMVEGYFFGDMDALALAGVGAASSVRRVGTDVEEFETDDPAFLHEAAIANAGRAERGVRPRDMHRHPKDYIDFLTHNGYRETTHGREALTHLSWRTATAAPHATQFARSLLVDIADRFALSLAPMPTTHTHPAVSRQRTARDAEMVLRNM